MNVAGVKPRSQRDMSETLTASGDDDVADSERGASMTPVDSTLLLRLVGFGGFMRSVAGSWDR